jgi:cell division septation protein DedD
MKQLTSAIILVALGAVVEATVFSAPPPKDASGVAAAERIVALRKERRDLLSKALEEVEELYKQSENMYLDVAPVLMNWRDADLDLASNRAARIKVRERVLEESKKVEDLVRERAARSQGQAAIDAVAAKAARLRAEIDLLQEQAVD